MKPVRRPIRHDPPVEFFPCSFVWIYSQNETSRRYGAVHVALQLRRHLFPLLLFDMFYG